MRQTLIEFSRHAKRRMNLYGISEPTVQAIIESRKMVGAISDGRNEVIDYERISEYGYPIKVVFSCKENTITVITAYPMKRGKK